MKRTTAGRVWRGIAVVACMATTLAGRAAPADISGEYADRGVVVEDATGQFASGASLHALLALQFDPRMAALLHDETERVGLWQGDREMEVRVHQRGGNVLTRARWTIVPGERLRALCRAGTTEYLFAFETVAQGKLLRVVLSRKDTTLLGPAVQTMGVFVFPRME